MSPSPRCGRSRRSASPRPRIVRQASSHRCPGGGVPVYRARRRLRPWPGRGLPLGSGVRAPQGGYPRLRAPTCPMHRWIRGRTDARAPACPIYRRRRPSPSTMGVGQGLVPVYRARRRLRPLPGAGCLMDRASGRRRAGIRGFVRRRARCIGGSAAGRTLVRRPARFIGLHRRQDAARRRRAVPAGKPQRASRRASAKRGMPASTISSEAVRLIRNQPGTSTIVPGRTRTRWRASRSVKATSSSIGERAIV